MTHRVPLVVQGTGPVVLRFREVLAARGDDIAGCEGIVLELVDRLGPDPSVLVVVDDAGLPSMMEAVKTGHGVATASLSPLTADLSAVAVLRADRRLGMSGALLPGLPLVDVLDRHADAGEVVTQVTLSGAPAAVLADEAVAVSALIGWPTRREQVRIEDGHQDELGWQAQVGAHRPTVHQVGVTEPAGIRTVTIWTDGDEREPLLLRGPAGGTDRVARALLADVLALARQADTPWRAHRRRAAAVR